MLVRCIMARKLCHTNQAILVSLLVLCCSFSLTDGFSFSWDFLNAATKANKMGGNVKGGIPENIHLLILPGFGNAAEDYTMDRSIIPTLHSRGWNTNQVSVLPIERSNWLNVFTRGCFDIEFWLADASPTRAAFRWYLDLVASEIDRIEKEWLEVDGNDINNLKIILIGHSAGGWLGRAAVGFGSRSGEPSLYESLDGRTKINLERILGIVTLGAPNAQPPAGVMDMTRGALRITNENFPGAYHSESMFYVTAIGNAVKGKEQKRKSFLEPTSVDGFAFNSYEAVCGDGNAIGDGVVPIGAAHLDGATQLELDNVFHSINQLEQWYGADAIIDQWLEVMTKQVNQRMKLTNAAKEQKWSFL